MINFLRILVVASCALLPPSLAAASGVAPTKVEGSVLIDLDRAMSLWEDEVVFVDVRPASNYDAGRILGAVNLPVDTDLTKDSINVVVDQDAPVVIYCNGIKCGLSAKAIPMLVDWGYSEIYYLREGFPGWEQAGLPIE